MKRVLALGVLFLILLTMANAQYRTGKGLLGDIDGSLILSHEDDTLDSDRTVIKSELSLGKQIDFRSIQFEPYYYFKNESFSDSISTAQLTENLAGVDLVIQDNEQSRVSTGLAYKYRYKSSGNNDSLMITRFKLDF